MLSRAWLIPTLCCLTVPIASAADPAQEEFAKLRGRWVVVSKEFGGKVADRKNVDEARVIVFADGKITFLSGRDLGEKDTGSELPGGPGMPVSLAVRLDPKPTPRAIDIVHPLAPLAGQDNREEVQRGIYLLEGDRLKLCLGWGKEARPAEFATKRGGTITLYVAQREQPETPLGKKFQPFASVAGRFAVELPGKPRESVKTLPDGEKAYHFAMPISRELVFFVGYLDVEEKFIKGKDPQERLKAFLTGSRRGAKIEDDTEIALGANKVPGRTYWVEAEKGFYVRERLYLDGNRIYWLYVGAEDKTILTSRDAERFFASFRITR